ncbi:MAG: Eco57I restriction-modification methylase domain-containing protein [Bacteroides sp.]|nr:Eco57I restriction-modification methylase domain-containing protein [Prevotella sp.]MCM1354521.1 Eco57I restriction-modification methylase domain-containing protein [Bacteroides sp.]MCM1443438.1 Eco57I restriction-modification methylase domain-containing protein [Muribaculum sp.]
MKTKYFEELKPKLIYVFRINDSAHKDCLKIGEATMDVDPDEVDITAILPNSKVLNKAARNRIDQYTTTAGIAYELLYTASASYRKGSRIIGFNDKDVHEVFKRSGIRRKEFKNIDKGGKEWFFTDLETVKRAIAAVKEGRESLNPGEITIGRSPVEFRPEQAEAIAKTVKLYKKAGTKTRRMLWNAKMRFGKTLSALQVAKEMQFPRTLILTHRPVVDAGWFEDFDKIFYDNPGYAYGSKNHGSSFENLENRHKKTGLHYVFFASMQDLRGSDIVGGKFYKNDAIFSTPWDYIIIDEAHEGTQTALGKAVITELTKASTKILQLSGTPFNLMDDTTEEEIFTWDYTMEQRAKLEWDRNHFGDTNPYAGLPRMNIYTYDLGRLMHDFADEDIAFNFKEFFRTNDSGLFLHHDDVLRFLNLLTKEDAESMYPFANLKYRNIFRHTLWMVPGVKAAKALSTMLKEHPVFGHFDIVNVAGDGDEEEDREEALKKVNKAIAEAQHGTITLSCGRLTTGVSVPQWMGVLMLSGSFNTAASAYMQTIFRVQTPYAVNGLVKEDCYVFDFAPDRTLQVLASVPRVSRKAGKTTDAQRDALGDFLNFCPVIGMEGSVMRPYDANKMMEQLKKAYVERVVRNGFEDGYLYTDELLKLDDVAVKDFDELKGIIGQTKAIGNSGNIDVNAQGLTNEEYEEKEKLEKKKKHELTDEEKARLEELKKKKKLKEDAVSILRGISIRMPLLIYGAKIDNEEEELTIDNFTALIDPQSWEEFMPRGVTKATFNKFKRYYDPDIFAAAGKRIRAMARAADRLTIEERIERITDIFSTFRNPDKETVLTPWRVVNMHMSDTLGGYTFFNKDFSETIAEPRYVEHHKVTDEVFAPGSHLLEINSKSGLYPLYLAYNLYRRACKDAMFSPQTLDEHLAIWDKVVSDSIFVICKTPMAKSITRRTLLGFRKGSVNMWAPEDLINKIKNQPELFIKKVGDLVGKNVKINAIVGNPPYQVNDGSGASDDAANPVYQLFTNMGKHLSPSYLSLIMPSKWMIGGKVVLKPFRQEMMQDHHISKIVDFQDSGFCFNGQHIDGGICYFLWQAGYDGKVHYKFITENNEIVDSYRYLSDGNSDIVIRDHRRQSIIEKVGKTKMSFKEIVSLTQPFGIRKDLFNAPERYPNSNLQEEPFENSVKIYGVKGIKGGARRISGYITKDTVAKNQDAIPKFKLFFTTSYSTNAINPPEPIIAGPNEVCTETFLLVGPFKNEFEQKNCYKFLQTTLFKCMIFFGRGTMQVSKDVFRFVPLQDFTSGNDIDWSKSVPEIDAQLYAKYGLTEDEIAFIESMIKPM